MAREMHIFNGCNKLARFECFNQVMEKKSFSRKIIGTSSVSASVSFMLSALNTLKPTRSIYS